MSVAADPAASFEGWRDAVRPLLAAGVKVDQIRWPEAVALVPIVAAGESGTVKLPAALMRLLDTVMCHRTDGRFELMYRLAWRTAYENPGLLEDAADADVRHATLMATAIRRDIHKMHAFVRFREFDDGKGPAYFAWFEPEHLILRKAAVFFIERFPNMPWTIATPDGAAVWDGSELKYVDALTIADRPLHDEQEDLWRTYYRSICNVARVNPLVMQKEMPQKYWRHLPEAAEIGVLIRDGMSNFNKRHSESAQRAETMGKAVKQALAALPAVGDGPQACRRCELWQHATQAVDGEGPADAEVMLVGEQPGDEEDLRGHPFVGPAGRVLDQAIESAGLARDALYITNAVKHFKWEPRGKRRLHKKPDVREINACNVWLEREIETLKPKVVVALGATAVRALLGRTLSIDAARRETLHHGDARVVATYHPSAILRAEGERVDELRSKLVEDLRSAGALATAAGTG